MIKLKLMADYQCFPLWWDAHDRVGDIDPKTLPISEELQKKLMDWAQKFDSSINIEDPLQSGFNNPKEEAKFIKEGEALLIKLKSELGHEYSIIYKK